MTDPTITCPNCKTEIKLTESLAAPLLESTRQQFQQQMAEKDRKVAEREAAIKAQQEELQAARDTIDEQVSEKLKSERAVIAIEEAKKARLLLSGDLEQKSQELADLKDVLKQRDEKLAEAQKAQAQVLKMQRELEDAKREIDLTVEKRIHEGLAVTREQAKKEVEDALNLKVAEKELTISSMQKQIEELKRKAEQGSQQLQGEIQELAIESALRAAFPIDQIEPVGKGEFGGDTLHRVMGEGIAHCGTILWESKRTKNWSDTWLPKLRNDKRVAGADCAIIVSQAMPGAQDTFEHIDGVWVTCPRLMIPVAISLRQALIELHAARQAGEGQQTKMELVYQYLTGPRFRHRVEAIVEKFSEMQEDLERERKTMTRLWAKREAQIRGVVESTAGMYGDLQGIAGKTLQEIEGLTLLEIAAPTPSNIDPAQE